MFLTFHKAMPGHCSFRKVRSAVCWAVLALAMPQLGVSQDGVASEIAAPGDYFNRHTTGMLRPITESAGATPSANESGGRTLGPASRSNSSELTGPLATRGKEFDLSATAQRIAFSTLIVIGVCVIALIAIKRSGIPWALRTPSGEATGIRQSIKLGARSFLYLVHIDGARLVVAVDSNGIKQVVQTRSSFAADLESMADLERMASLESVPQQDEQAADHTAGPREPLIPAQVAKQLESIMGSPFSRGRRDASRNGTP